MTKIEISEDIRPDALAKSSDKTVVAPIVFGFFLALVAMGLPMIGITINLYLGAIILLVAFIALAYGFWKWEVSRRFSESVRVSTLWIVGLLYFALIGLQISRQYRKDHSETPFKALPESTTYAPREHSPIAADPPTKAMKSTAKPEHTIPALKPSPKVATDTVPAIPQHDSIAGSQPTFQQECVGSACAQGEGSQATFNQYGSLRLTMSDTQRDQLAAAMSAYSGMEARVACQAQDDTVPYAEKFVAALQLAGMKVPPADCPMILAPSTDPPGVSLFIGANGLSAAKSLATAMHNAGLISLPLNVNTGGITSDTFVVVVRPNR